MSSNSSNKADIDLSVVWSTDRYTIQELINNEYASFSESKSLLVKIHCMKKGCRCVLKNEQALTLKCVSQVTLVRGIWSKNGAKLSSSSLSASQVGSNKVVNVIISSSNITWFEILNEAGQTTPGWSSTKMIVKNKPSSFLIRRDLKCLLPRRTSSDTFQLCLSQTGSVSAGTVLNYVQYKEFFVQKGKKSKEMFLIQCCDNNLANVFLFPDEKASLSPLAGLGSIGGVHNLYSVIQQFQLPLSVRPAFGCLADWLPAAAAATAADKSALRLCESFCGELVFLEPLSNPGGDRFFVITPEMLEAHQISLGESQNAHHQNMLTQHSTRVEQFLLSCHPYEGLRYLLRHLADTTNVSPGNGTTLKSTAATTTKTAIHGSSAVVGSGGGKSSGGSHDNCESQETQSKLDKLFDEIEDIYYYVRTGRFPTHPRSTYSQQARSLSWHDLNESHNENKPPLPPLPLRVYFNMHQAPPPPLPPAAPSQPQAPKSPVLPHRCSLPPPSVPHNPTARFVVNNPSYDDSFHTLLPPHKKSLLPN